MKKVVFIIPYFGKFNNYFQLFLNSCEKNSDFNWLIFTDDKTEYNYPKNVKVIYMSFEELRKIFCKKFKDIILNLGTPYKLCDFKPTYGYVFSDYIKEYDYWGHCDNDLIFGKISNFINNDILSKYDKIGVLGHLTLYKNTPEINSLFFKNDRFLTVASSEAIFQFDEEFNNSINNTFVENKKDIYQIKEIADIYVKSSNFKITNYQSSTNSYCVEKKDKNFYLWNDGILTKNIISNGKIIIKEYLYIHIQKRSMKVNNQNFKIYKIIPNSFDDIEQAYFNKKYSKIKTKHFNLHYFRFRTKCLINKIKKIIKK